MKNRILLQIFRFLQDFFAKYWVNRMMRNFVYTAQKEKIRRTDGRYAVEINNKYYKRFHDKVYEYIPLV